METLDEFGHHLRDALAHLYDPGYRAAEVLWAATGCDPRQGVGALQQVLVNAIQSLEPAPNVPSSARIRRIHEILSYRYVQGLTQEKTAQLLGITPRHLRREQNEAIEVLARRLWQPEGPGGPGADAGLEWVSAPAAPAAADVSSQEWRSQVKQELASLRESALGAVANVGETLEAVVELGAVLASRQGVRLELGVVEPELYAAIHPSALRQVLITALGKLTQGVAGGEIVLRARAGDRGVRISAHGHPAREAASLESELVQEILATHGGAAQITLDGDRVSLDIDLPSGDEITVLVVDDNTDLVHFYRRYITGTRYRITHLASGQRVFPVIQESPPDIIVLDVMLPDVDGWELLVHLYEQPETRSIPVIVCSVVREEELALSLGAAVYLPKPVRRQEFIEALNQALSRG